MRPKILLTVNNSPVHLVVNFWLSVSDSGSIALGPRLSSGGGGQPGLKVRADVFGTPYFFRLSAFTLIMFCMKRGATNRADCHERSKQVALIVENGKSG